MALKLKARVAETSTSTGTGDITLAGAITGHSTFASRLSVADTTEVVIYAVDSNNVPTGEWEEVPVTYSAANTLTRGTPTASSNSDAAVSFSAGTKIVVMTPSADRLLRIPDTYVLPIAAASSRSGKDTNGIYTTVEYRRADNTLISRSVLSGGTSPEYTTRTETIYAADGTTVLATNVYTLAYSGGDLVSEDLA